MVAEAFGAAVAAVGGVGYWTFGSNKCWEDKLLALENKFWKCAKDDRLVCFKFDYFRGPPPTDFDDPVGERLKELDTDGDGSLSKEEFILGENAPRVFFEDADLNKDGQINRGELQRAMAGMVNPLQVTQQWLEQRSYKMRLQKGMNIPTPLKVVPL